MKPYLQKQILKISVSKMSFQYCSISESYDEYFEKNKFHESYDDYFEENKFQLSH